MPRFQDSLGRHARLGHAQVQRHIRPPRGKPPVHLHHLGRIRVLQRHAIPRETQPVEQFAMFQRTCQHCLPEDLDRHVFPAAPDRPSRNSRQPATHSHVPRPHRPGTAPCLATAGYVRSDKDGRDCSGSYRPAGPPPPPSGNSPEDRRKDSPRALPDFAECLDIARRVGGNSHDAGPRFRQLVDLRHSRLNIGSFRGAHTLHHDRIAGTNGDRSDLDRSGGIREIAGSQGSEVGTLGGGMVGIQCGIQWPVETGVWGCLLLTDGVDLISTVISYWAKYQFLLSSVAY